MSFFDVPNALLSDASMKEIKAQWEIFNGGKNFLFLFSAMREREKEKMKNFIFLPYSTFIHFLSFFSSTPRSTQNINSSLTVEEIKVALLLWMGKNEANRALEIDTYTRAISH